MPRARTKPRRRTRAPQAGAFKGPEEKDPGGVIPRNLQNRYPVMSPYSTVLGGFPGRAYMTLKYVDNAVVLDPAAGSLDSVTFSLRGMFDPDQRIGGHQPSNFDRWSVLYAKYTVLKTRVTMCQNWNSTSSVGLQNYGFLISRDGASVPGISPASALLEQPYVKYAAVGAGALNSSAAVGNICATIPHKEWLGFKQADGLFSEGAFATVGTNPVQDVFVEFFGIHINGNDPGAVPYRIELEFDCCFFDPNITLPS